MENLSPVRTQLHRIPKWQIVSIGILFFCLLICGGLYYLLERPQYIELKIIPPEDARWSYTQTAIQDWGTSRYFIWRRETQIYGCCNSGIKSWDSIIDYFNKSLIQEGWQLATDGNDPCAFTPESNFLKRGKDYLVYKRLDSEPYGTIPAVCVVVWPIEGSSAKVVPEFK